MESNNDFDRRYREALEKLEPCPVCNGPLTWDDDYQNVLECAACTIEFSVNWPGHRGKYALWWNDFASKVRELREKVTHLESRLAEVEGGKGGGGSRVRCLLFGGRHVLATLR